MIFCAQLRVGHDHAHLSACSRQDEQNGKKKTHKVVHLVQPKSAHDKGHFNADASKGQETSNKEHESGMSVNRRFRDEASNGIGLDWEFHLRFFQSQKSTEKDQRRRDADPKQEEDEDSQETNSSGSSGRAQENVHDGKNNDHESRQADRKCPSVP